MGILIVGLCGCVPGLAARRRKPSTSKPSAPLAWAYVRQPSVRLLKKPGDPKAVTGKLRRGQLAAILGTKLKNGTAWARLMAANPANLEELSGWVDSRLIEQFPSDRFPPDRKLLDSMGGAYLEDFVATHAVIARFLVPSAQGQPLLLGYVGSRALPQVRLQIFQPANGHWVAGPFLDFPYASMGTALQQMAVRDFPGTAGECLVATEAEPAGLGASLKTMTIRQVTPQGFRTVWQAPLEQTNFTYYPPRIHVLAPAAKNIGAPGTQTHGQVTFKMKGGGMVPVWSGQVGFYVVGRSAPVQTLKITKVCLWNGARFEPLE